MSSSSSPYSGSSSRPYYYPNAPSAPDPNQPCVAYPYQHPTGSPFGSGSNIPPPQGYGNYYPYNNNQQQQQHNYSWFPPGTHPDVIRSFQMVDRNQNGYSSDVTLFILGIFERFDRDRSGKIDVVELRDALYTLGYALPPSVLQVLISRYDNGSGRRVELTFDSFVECGMIVKGLTEKFKEKDPRYTGSATLNYDNFMSMIIPFLVS
ncbi:hypothetical protein RD792_009873 [Penstemon davidsonii]|uniref:EF-hand domain-containing protein n=1 Tax=Penstemon davidsonii TaxID=160366 RepID=A0ABR0D1G3_9LAMI|nr:hypothetical protein RD792_009873 [Penstemon davidsonii]